MKEGDGLLRDLERQNTSQLLRMPYQAFIGRLFERLAAEGYADVHPAHAILFQHLEAAGLRISELAKRAQLTKQYVGRLVADLEAAGYLEHAADPTDGRAKLVRLSPLGRKLTETAEAIIQEIEADWAQRVGTERYAGLRLELANLISALEA